MSALVLSTFAFSFGAAVPLAQASNPPNWNTTGDYVVNMVLGSTSYPHDMHLTQDSSGNLTGGGGSPAGANVYTWVIDSGSVSGNAIAFTAHYTATADASTTVLTVAGSINPDGSMSGTWSDNYPGPASAATTRTGTWTTTSGAAASIPSIPTVVTVTQSNLQGWTASSAAGAQASIVADSSHTGNGALELTTTSDVNSVTHFTRAFDVPLSDLSQLSYDTKQIAAADTTNGNATLRISINLDGTGTTVDDQLMYEPYYNGFSGSTGWNTWTITKNSGELWSNYGVTYNGITNTGAGGAGQNVTLADVLHNHPNAKIVGLVVSMGTYNVSQNVHVDDVTLNGTTYDFELSPASVTVAANPVTSTGATLNGTNGDTAADYTSFWWGTTNISDPSPSASPTLPSGWSHADFPGTQAAGASFSDPLTGLTPNTPYYFVAWVRIDGTWYPGAVLHFTTGGSETPAAPTVSAISPNTGTIAGGNTVTITGTGFTGATAVTFGGMATTSFSVNGDGTSITVASPATTTTGIVNVTVTTPGGTSALSAADQFTYELVGTVTSAGVLHVDSIVATKTSATSDGTFANGWVYTFNITVPTGETNLAMKFANWLNGTNVLPVAHNMRIFSAQSSNATNEASAIPLTAADTYSSPLHITGDLASSTPGLQVAVTVEVAIPVGTADGSYTTSYGVQTQP